ncbi:MAG: carbohydrate-binding family 9-like protein [Cyclobacteriaceae bacterium]|nr:carbohydrate-binding family 9-like protein [Cyclobacteriaceae bacterium]
MKKIFLLLIFHLSLLTTGLAQKVKADDNSSVLVKATTDFELSGDGSSSKWEEANWVSITQQANQSSPMETKFKVLYSEKGIYFLFYNEDASLDASILADNKHLWKEDVVEVFLWADTTKEVYFEYELSPLNYELPLMVMNIEGQRHRWQPWFYEDDRAILHQTAVQGGSKKSGASIKSWTGDFFIPFSLLLPIGQMPPISGAEWKANMYRMDYVNKKGMYWSWKKINSSFHEIQNFGTLIFE